MNYLSLFSGIEAASVAWKPLGWTCVGVAEIDPFPCAVLAHHYPAVPNLGSVTDITDEQIAALGPIDVVVGGSPCQDLSVAGKRVGLAGERSGLFHHQLRIFHAARHLCGARFIVWENVPGAFSTHGGRDFAVVVGAMAGCELPVPADGWGTEGVALGEHGLVEWAVLDAQWFGVAQRRRRVFAVLDVGDWSARPPILLEPDRLRGDSAPSREAGEGSTAGVIKGAAIGRQPHNGPQYGDAIADGSCYTLTTNEVHAVAHSLRGDSPPSREAGKDVAPTIAARTRGGGGLGTDFDCDGGLVVGVAHSLRAEGFDASEDGTGRGTPIVPVAFDTTQITSAANYSRPKAGDPCHPLAAGAHAPAIAFMADDYKDGGYEECDTSRPLTTSADRTRAAPVIAFSGKDYGADAGEVAPTLRGMGHDSSHANGGGQVAVVYGEIDACTQKADPHSPLRALREAVGAQAFAEWGLGILDSLHSSEVLRQAMHGVGVRLPAFSRSWVVCCALGSPFSRSEGAMQSLREAGCTGCSPQGWEPPEQLARELGTYLSGLSHPGAQAERLMRDLWRADEGTGVLREALSAIQEARRSAHGQGEPARAGLSVRRLTTTECTFLQGFPRNYLDIAYRGKPAADGPKYKALGNSMAVPVMRWIGEQIQLAAA